MAEEITFKNNLKKWLDNVKAYTPVFLVIITLLGAIWQGLSLMSFGMPYLRFFSLSQLVPDGIILMILVPLVSFIPVLMAIIALYVFRPVVKRLDTYYKIVLPTVGISSGIYEGFNIAKRIYEGKGVFGFIESKDFMVLVLSIMGMVVLFSVNFEKVTVVKTKLQKVKKILFLILHPFSRLTAVINLLIIVILTLNYVERFGRNNTIPKNFVNYDYFEDYMYDNYGLLVDYYHIAYFNDKYIFVKYHPDKMMPHSIPINENYEYSILVLEIDKLFPPEGYKMMEPKINYESKLKKDSIQ
ncbi:hypothetical protein M0G43_11500 [Subsaxibacter sp. CAU 1640]|uniref:hypothetical protein n=1 Tax=Subsaxibacter sp. CAU 1640 TaxID=2933271 RepID=UPI00200449B2|nr:hypothetical protein [Subsaxibacter sp. CAU 1640]MCK7591202.1 hypothetical protein [Subsaxibacter sp. CAU 1640]